MANTVAISQVGGTSDGSGLPPGSGTPPGNVSAITVSGTLDPVALEISLVVNFTPPSDPGDTWTGVHVYLDIPDHGDGSAGAKVGTAVVGTSKVLGPFNPIDLGLQTNPTQPWYFSCPFPDSLGLNPNLDIPCRLYLASISVVSASQLIQDGLPNATPNVAFTLVSTTSGTPTSGTNVTVNCGTITCQALPVDTSTGKSMSPFLALMGSVPSKPPKGWGYRLYLYTGTTFPTSVTGLTPLTDVCTTAGEVPPAKADLITDVLNSFAVQTPTTTTTLVVYAVAGLVGAGGAFTANAIVPNITESCAITLGSTTGTIDASQAILASLSTEMSVIAGKFGITLASLSNNFLASGAAGANLTAAGPILNAGTVIANNTITGALMATTGIITASAQIGTAVIADANIGSCNVSKLTAGTATFSSTVTFQNSAGPEVIINSTEVQVTGGAYTIGVNSSSGITISSSSSSLAITSTGMSISASSNYLVLTSTELILSYGGSGSSFYPNISVFSSNVYVSASSTNYLEITGSSIQLVTPTFTTIIDSSGLYITLGGSGSTSLTDSEVASATGSFGSLHLGGSLYSSASSGSDTLPANPVGFIEFTWGPLDTPYKFPVYNP